MHSDSKGHSLLLSSLRTQPADMTALSQWASTAAFSHLQQSLLSKVTALVDQQQQQHCRGNVKDTS